MSKTIDIALIGNDTHIEVNRESGLSHSIIVSLWKDGLSLDSDGTNRSITVSFDTLSGVVSWNNIIGKPDGKLFGGVITPDSAIPTTSADVYYMAYEAGFYTNFGFTLAEGTMAFVYRSGNEWVRTTVPMDTVGFVQGTRENQTYFGNSEMDELNKNVAFYYGREGFFMKTAEDNEVMTFTLVASAINIDNVDGVNVASFYLRGALMFVNKAPNEGTNDYYHWFYGESTQFYLKDAMDQMATYFEENKLSKEELYNILGFPVFDASLYYAQGDVVLYNGDLYVFTTDHHGQWNIADVEHNDIHAELKNLYVDLADQIDGKQDTISDLATIRSGAAAGATAIQSSEKGTASGVATLDSGGKVPQSQLPSYVDDVLEYANIASFPATGESGKIYVALDTNKTYRWSGSTYVEISQSLAIGETESTAFAGNRGKAIEEKIPSNASPSNKLATEAEAVPKGGTTGQVLAKHSDNDNDVEWIDPPESGTGDYEELENLPSINGVTLLGDLETEDLNIEALTNEEIDQLLV